MSRYNTVLRMDEEGVIYRQVVFTHQMIKVGEMGAKNRKEGINLMGAEESKRIAQSRAKSKVRDYVCTNKDLTTFVTYTLSPKKVEDRYDEKLIYKQVRNWLSDNVKRRDFKYVLVPEPHEDGAWHFHGFVNKDLDWKLGCRSATRIKRTRDRNKVIAYITSYINKTGVKFNGRYYLHSNNLKDPTKIYDNVAYTSVEGGYEKALGFGGIGVKIVDFN